MILLVYPAKEVEAKKSTLDSPAELQVRHTLPLSHNSVQPEAFLEDSVAVAPAASMLQAAAISHEEAESEQPADLSRSVSVVVESGDSLSSIFAQLDIGHSLLVSILEQDKNSKRFTNLKAGQELVFTFDASDALESITSQLSPLESIEITRSEENGRYAFSKHVQQTTQVEAVASGTIDGSLLAATQAAGLPYKLALDLANVFAYDIDFARDLRTGDSFEVVYEQKMLDEEVVGTGVILAARFTNKGKTLTAVRYADASGQTAYYNSDGTSSRRAFIRTPVDFARISSKFNPNRRHPVLNKIRAHRGVDYAAPTGTPIKATGNGKISFVGNKNGYGKTIIVQHGNQYRTLYAHMNGFAKGMRKGSTVNQGQIIGYVGMTGLATGPHLHYEFHVNGTHVDPLSHKLPTADPIPKKEMARFKQATQNWVAMLDKESSTTQLAQADIETP
jgi:murein DD-endopeptidase MepM/ murein hydrolase activator NlpD